MTPADTIILVIVAGLAIAGFRQGFVVGLFSLGGFIVGIVVATRLAQAFAPRTPYAPVLALAGALLLAIMLASVLEGLGVVIRERMHLSGGAAVDRVLGAGLSALIALLLVWVLAAVVVATPQLRPYRHYVFESRVLPRVNRALPPSGPLLNMLARYDPLPGFSGPKILVGAPDPRLSRDPQVRAAARSVVRVTGTACGYEITGSGWFVSRHLVVTNAHVVAGEGDTAIEPFASTANHPARVVYFDAHADVAILRVPSVSGRPLRMAPPHANEAGAILGYPENGPFDTRPARYSDTRTVSSDDIYGAGSADRTVTSFRGLVRHGNSGGPVVAGDGSVMSTVFATTTSGIPGGYGVPNETVQQALAGPLHEVGTGNCIA